MLVMLATSCTSMDGVSGGPQSPGQGTCSTNGLEWAIGQSLDEATGRRLLKESGAGLWRAGAPEQAMLKDHRTDRLTIMVDGESRITSLRCE